PLKCSTPAILSSDGFAKCCDISTCSSERMLTVKYLLRLKALRLAEVFDWLHSTSGGSSDTDENELAVSPWHFPAESHVVMTVTPVVKAANTARNPALSKSVVLFII